MAIKILSEKKLKTKSKPYYNLIINYMIGDADGYTDEKAKISINNPFLEKFCKILNKLKNPKGKWGFGLDFEAIEVNYKEKHIIKDEYLFMVCMISDQPEDWDENTKNYLKSEKEKEFAYEFVEICKSETEYSFLTYQGFELIYIDEYKKHHKTKIN